MKAPVHLRVERVIDAPLRKVWDTVAHGFGQVSAYNPAIRSSTLISSERSGVGCTRRCVPMEGGFLEERITEWEEQRRFKLILLASSFPMAVLESEFTFTPVDGGTRVQQDLAYRMRAPMCWLSSLMKGRMRKTLVRGLDGLAVYLGPTR